MIHNKENEMELSLWSVGFRHVKTEIAYSAGLKVVATICNLTERAVLQIL